MRIAPLLTNLALAVLSQIAASAFAQDWPQFRGPSGDGCVTAKNLPERWGGFDAPAWQTEIAGSGWSSPVVVGGRVWLTSAKQAALDEKEREKKLASNPILTPDFQTHASATLLAIEIDAGTGKILRQIDLFTFPDP